MSEKAYLYSYIHSMVRLASKKGGNEPFMTEEQLYRFLEIEMPRDIIIIDDNEKENEQSGIPARRGKE